MVAIARPLGRLLLIVVAFGYLFTMRIGWDRLVATLEALDWRRVPYIVLGQVCFVALGGLALWLLLGGLHPVPLGAFLPAYWRGVAAGVVTPVAIGEVSLAWLLRPYGVPVGQGVALVLLDKLITVVAMAALAAPMIGWWASSWLAIAWQPRTWWLLAAAAVAGLLLLLAARIARRSAARFESAERVWSRARSSLASLRALSIESPARLAGNFGLSLLRAVVAASVLWWSIETFGALERTSFVELLVLSAAARLVTFALPAPNGLGVYEVALVELLSPGKATAEVVLSGALLSRVVGLLVVAAGFLVASGGPSTRVEP
jgi:uncharacterized membrane protein YbhN (UPF0104 family)